MNLPPAACAVCMCGTSRVALHGTCDLCDRGWRGTQVAASENYGCSQVVYTMPNGPDARDATLSECGAMNVFFLMQRPGGGVELVTPPLDGTILPGVTRDSVIQLCQGYAPVQHPLHMQHPACTIACLLVRHIHFRRSGHAPLTGVAPLNPTC
jgi:hypothetical protein